MIHHDARSIRPRRNSRLVLAAAVSLAVCVTGCGGDVGADSNTVITADPAASGASRDPSSGTGSKLDRPLVVCTTAMIGDLATEIAGDAMTVEVLFGPNIDPHLFRPARDDVALLLRADLVVYNGHTLEGYLVETLKRVEENGTDLIALAEVILEPGEAISKSSAIDPHVWMDPSIWLRGCERLADAFERELAESHRGTVEGEIDSEINSEIDSEINSEVNAAIGGVHARADSLAKRLQDLDLAFEARLATIPTQARVLVTAHDAFGYFGRRYGIEVLAIQGFSTASEAGLLAIEDLVDQLADRRIPAVFFESSVSERNVRALIEGAESRGHTVSLGGTLHSDAPGAAKTYEAMVRHNVATIVEALGGSANTSGLTVPSARSEEVSR